METGFKGTPGPWVPKHSEKQSAINVIGTVLGAKYKIARCPFISESAFDKVESEANAKLIAAAPEMLEALVRVKSELLRCDILDERTEKFIDAVMAKATGGKS